MKKLLHYYSLVVFLLVGNIGYAQYCTTSLYSTGCNFGDDLNDVTIGNVIQTSTGCTGGYDIADYTSDTINVQQSLFYSVSITSNYSNQYYNLYIDFNDDGDWTDAGEEVWSTSTASGTAGTVTSGTFQIPLSAPLGNHRVRLRSTYNGSPAGPCSFENYGEIHDYTMNVAAAPACPPPSSVMVSSIGSTTATVSWTGSSAAYNIEYDTLGFTLGTGMTDTVTAASVALTGLMPNTTYTVYVEGDCSGAGNGLSPLSLPVTFTTSCAAYSTFPFTENFDGASWIPDPSGWSNAAAVLDQCWSGTPTPGNGNFWGPRAGSLAFASGPATGFGGSGNCVYTQQDWGYTNDSAILTSPVFDFSSLTTPYLTFKYFMYGKHVSALYVQVTNDAGATWTTISSLYGEKQSDKSDPWLEATASLTGYNTSAVKIRFVAVTTGAGLTEGNIAIDNVVLDEAPSCPPPFNMTATAITDSTITLNWSGSAGSYTIEYGLCGASQGTGTTITSSTNSATLNGLIGNQSYSIWIQSDCTGSSNGFSTWAYMGCEQTVCSAFDQISSYSEDFDLGTSFEDIDCWSYYGSNGNVELTYYQIASWEVSNPSAPNVARLYYQSDTLAMAISPKFADLDNNLGQVSFKMIHNSWTGDTLDLYIVSLSDPSTPWNFNYLDTVSIHTTSYSAFTQFLDNVPAGDKYLGFALVNPPLSFVSFMFDDFLYEAKPSCTPPTTHTVVATSIDSIALTWSGGSGTTYNVEYNVCGSAQGTGTSVTGLTSASNNFTGLSTGTNYSFWIQNDCGGGIVSPWYGPFCVSTDVCLPTDQCTYTVILEDSWGDGWNGGLVSFEQNGVVLATVGSGFTTGNWDTAYIDLCTLQSTDAVLFDAGFYSYEMGITVIDPFGNTKLTVAPSGWPGPVTGAILGNFMADCTVPSCPDPTNITFSGIDGYNATAAWNIFGSSQSQFIVEWGAVGFLPGQGTGIGIDSTTSLNYTISTGLIPVTCYDFYVMADCATNGNSSWAGPYNFCTDVSCPAPTSVTLNSVSQTTAEFGWTSTGGDWNIIIGPAGTTPGTGTVQSNITSNPHTITSLTPGTVYEFWVRDSCGLGDVSTWTGPFTFATLCNPFSLNYLEDFNTWSGGPLPCWSNDGTAAWQSESGYAKADFWNNSTGVYEFKSPAITISGQARLRFKWSSNLSTFYNDRFIVMSREVGSATWDTLMDLAGSNLASNDGATNTSPGTFVEDTFALPASYVGSDAQIFFKGISNWGPNLYIDDVTVELDPAFVTCPAPAALTSTNITTTGADLSWAGGSGTFLVEYGPAGFPVGSGTIVTSATASTSLSTLTAATSYTAYVREICSPGDTSVYSAPHNFSTEICDATNKCDFTFILSDSFGDGWNGGLIEVKQNGITVDIVGSSFSSGSFDTVYVSLCDGFSTDITVNNPGFYFSEMGYSILDPNGNVVSSYAAGSGSSSVGSVLSTFSASCTGCSVPTGIADTSSTCAELIVNWNSSSSVAYHMIEYGPTGFTPGSGTVQGSATKPLVVSGLTGGANYDYYVMDTCTAGSSNWSSAQSITMPTGPLPTISYTVSNSNVSGTASTFDFDASASGGIAHWDFGTGDTAIASGAVQYDYTANGNYTVTLSVINGCGSTDSTFTVNVTGIGIVEPSFGKSLSIYPNPTLGNVNIDFSVNGVDDVTISIVNALGQTISKQKLGNVSGEVNHNINLSSKPKGVYLVQIESNEGRVIRRITLQ